jgi:hypothetical protein
VPLFYHDGTQGAIALGPPSIVVPLLLALILLEKIKKGRNQ